MIYMQMVENQNLEFGKKLRIVRNMLKKSQAEFAEMLNTDQPTLSKYENKHYSPHPNTIDDIKDILIKKLHVSPRWWETGEGDVFLMYTGQMVQEGIGMYQSQSNGRIKPIITDGEFVELPFVSIPARATFADIGDGVNVDMYETFLVYRRSGEDLTNQIVIEIDGDSMEPYYISGSKVRAKKVPVDRWPYITSGVYAISVAGSFLVKRIKNNDYQSGYFLLHSDNETTGGSLKVKIEDIRSIWKVLRIVDSPAR